MIYLKNKSKMSEQINIVMEENHHISFSSGEFLIQCVIGTVWVTWPGSGDVILHGTDEISIATKGTLCITSFADSRVNIQKRKLPWIGRDISRLVRRNIPVAVSSLTGRENRRSVYGG